MRGRPFQVAWQAKETVAALGVHYRTVQRWVDWYRDGGGAAVRAHRLGGHGQPAFLSAEAEAAVADPVATGRFRTAAAVGEWIADPYGVRYRPGGLASLLARLQCAPKVPRPVHEQADLAEQDRCKRGGSRRPSRQPGSPRARRSASPMSCGWACGGWCGGSGAGGR